ncbi:phosphonate ABC transporter ATP-binding protein [Bosea sp. PAMC 26642]|uniref:phosphonate ABC transporter ATP-binding protein n=1 Tax=Bosea sp. (strain PAMC 26642) TaxID=1792307 RepID=UPI0007701D78|nr:phosphonate ABC transporter ATP-binding protein [Bosea sp. PAMC 26642]AMJ63699.1 phosphonate ABC transporter ATP-binding protein [Bosea sp. PAMC 26642]
MLRIEGLTKRFSDKAAVDNVTLDLPKGEMVGIIGRSGAGKSTLLRMINRLAEPSAGRILSEDRDVTGLHGAALRAWRRDTAMIFQQFNLVGRLDVLTNVLLGRLNHRSAMLTLVKHFSQDDKIRAIAALERLDMGHLLSQRAETLSGGQQQRVAIARALVQEPKIILADEPIASLDPRNTQVVMDALFRINREDGITVVCNLHHLDIASKYCDRLIGMAAGKVVFDGPPHQLTSEVAAALYGIEARDAGAEALDALDVIAGEEARRAKQNAA